MLTLFVIILSILLMNSCQETVDPLGYQKDPQYIAKDNALRYHLSQLNQLAETYQTAKKLYEEAQKEPGRNSLEKERSNYFKERERISFGVRNWRAAQYALRYEQIEAQKRYIKNKLNR